MFVDGYDPPKEKPSAKLTIGRPALYPLKSMKVGEMYFAKGKTMRMLGSSVSVQGKKLGRKFTCRTVEGGVMIWRLS